MSNELDYDHGVDVTLIFALANPGASASTAMTLAQGGAGFKVPSGYKFHPLCLAVHSNADLSAGLATAKVTGNGTIISNGPEPALSDTVQQAAAVARAGASPIAAGELVGVKLVTDGSYAPTTADHDAVLIGKLLPA